MSKADEPEEGWTKKDGVWFRNEDLPIIMAPDTVELQSMRRNWWIKYRWVNITPLGNKNILYLKTGIRPIEEVQSAANDFDLFMKVHKYE